MGMTDRLTLSAAETMRLIPLEGKNTGVPHVDKGQLRASMQQAMAALTDGKSHYSLDSLADRQEVLDQQRRENLLATLEAEDDLLADDSFIDIELTAGAHLEELQDVLNDYSTGAIRMSQETVDDMVGLMTELRQIMPQLPDYLVNEIKAVARPLRKVVSDYEQSVEII